MKTSHYILARDDSDRSFVALFSDAAPSHMLASIVVPAGADQTAVQRTLQVMARLSHEDASAMLRAHPDALGRAAERCSVALSAPVRIIDIAHDAGRVAWASPGADGTLLKALDAALVPIDAADRRRRCDAVLQLLHGRERALIADRLGDIAERPMSGADSLGLELRSAALADALTVLSVEAARRDVPAVGEVLILTGFLASEVARGSIPLMALAPFVSSGCSTVLLDLSGVIAVVGSEQLTNETGTELIGAIAAEVLSAAGDLFRIGAHRGQEVEVQIAGEEYLLSEDDALELDVRPGESRAVQIAVAGQQVTALLHGGLGGLCVLRGHPDVRQLPASSPIDKVVNESLPVPVGILPKAAGATGGLGGRLLLGDEVSGYLHYSSAEPDSRGWAAAHESGILAIPSVSPETVLRARAVGIRGLVVGSLSDGEREALTASMERRVAAGVALAPFGLLILGGRRESDEWAAELGVALNSLHGQDVQLQRQPAGLIATKAHEQMRHREGDVIVIDGPHAGTQGHWRGLTMTAMGVSLGAVEIAGTTIAIPLGDLQRLTA